MEALTENDRKDNEAIGIVGELGAESTKDPSLRNPPPPVEPDSCDSEPARVMAYEDAEGQRREEPICSRCRSNFVQRVDKISAG